MRATSRMIDGATSKYGSHDAALRRRRLKLDASEFATIKAPKLRERISDLIEPRRLYPDMSRNGQRGPRNSAKPNC